MTSWDKFVADYQGKKVLIMGLGLQGGGVEVAKIFSQIGCQVTVTDLRSETILKSSLIALNGFPIRFVLGKHEEADFIGHDVIIRNPAIPGNSSFLALARKNHLPIKMETALFAKYTPTTIIGVTGTRGKSTTAHLIYEVLKASGKSVFLAGNLPAHASLPLLKTLTAKDLVVLELSSWQLQGFGEEKISPHIAVMTNIYPDHMNRYTSMAAYAADKKHIFRYQKSTDFVILNADNPEVKALSQEACSQIIWFSRKDLPSDLSLKIPGTHNLENAAAASKVAEILHLDRKLALKTIADFPGVPFRLQKIATINKITVINDTTSTTPTATIKAIESTRRPIMLILGGETKNLPIKDLAQKINRDVDKVILLSGSGTKEIKPLLKTSLIAGEFTDLLAAVKKSLAITARGTLLFSPGFTSFGLFNNEFDRGEVFNQIIGRLSQVS